MNYLPVRTLVITAACLCSLTLAAPATQPFGEVYVGGDVVCPGAYSVNRGGTVLDLVGWAHGTSAKADFEVVIYRNTADGKLKQSITINSLEELKKHPDAAPSLRVDDHVVVKALKPGAA